MGQNNPHQRRGRDRAEARRVEVARLRRQGMSLQQIADEIGCSKATVGKDCELLRSRWRSEAAQDYDALMAAEFEQLSAIRYEAWDRFEDSRTEKRPEGDPRLLQLALQASSRIQDLLGLDDPVKFQARQVRADEGTESHVDIVEVVVSDRGELDDITDEEGVIRLSEFKKRIYQKPENDSKTA